MATGQVSLSLVKLHIIQINIKAGKRRAALAMRTIKKQLPIKTYPLVQMLK
jgi:hypothetical protein